MDALESHILGIVRDSQQLKPKRGSHSTEAIYVDERKLVALSGRVMKRLVMSYDDFPEGISWKQMMDVAAEENEAVGLDPRQHTVVVDRLIDNSLAITGIREINSRTGHRYVVRTFKPEGEVVSDRIRQQIMVRDPECLIVT